MSLLRALAGKQRRFSLIFTDETVTEKVEVRSKYFQILKQRVGTGVVIKTGCHPVPVWL